MSARGLQFETVSIAFTQGLDTKTQPKLTMPGKWNDLRNLTLSEDNTPRTRDGHVALVAAASGNGLATYNEELLTLAGPTVSSVSLAAGAANAMSGLRGFVDISKQEVRRSTGMQDEPDCATGDGYTCYVWREKSPANAAVGINCTLIDEATGTQLLANFALRTNALAQSPRVVFNGNAFFITYVQGQDFFCRVIATSAPTVVGAEVALITSASLGIGVPHDTCAFGANSGAMAVYAWSDGTTSVRSIEIGRAGTVPSITAGPTNVFAEATSPVATLAGLSCAAFDNTLAGVFGMFDTSNAVNGATIDNSWVVVTAEILLFVYAAPASNCHITACLNGANMQVFVDSQGRWSTNALSPISSGIVDSVLNVVATGNIINSNTFGAGVTARGPQGPFIWGKAFTSGGRMFLPVFVASVYTNAGLASSNPRTQNTQNTFFVLDCGAVGTTVGTGVVVAKALYGSFGAASVNGSAPRVGVACSTPALADGGFAIVATELTQLVLTSTAINVSPTGLVRLTMTPNFSLPTGRVQLGETTYLSGGSLTGYDGAAVVEQGFPLFPEGCAITVNGAGGAMTAGVHQVCFIYEWIDNAGQRNQSAPSLPITVTTVANDSLTCVIPTLQLSQKTNIQVVAFMTQAGGLVFNRVLLDNSAYAPVINTTAANSVTITIDDSDATIAGNELLYTQPNVAGTTLANVAPGPTSAVCVAQNRLFFLEADQPFQLGYSQELINNVGLQFSPDLSRSFSSDSGGGAAVAAMDEKVIVFGRRRIYAMYGTGPSPSGGFNNYSQLQDIQADVGCSDPLSVLGEFPGGIIFKSQKGMYLLQRDLTVKYIGEGIARFDSLTVTSAVLLEDVQEVRFTTSGTVDGMSGIILVYSYLVDQWSYFTITPSGNAYLPIDGAWWPAAGSGAGRYVTISLADGLNQDSPGLYVDGPGLTIPTGVVTTARTGWLHLTALEGFQRARWLYLTATAPAGAASNLAVTVYFDDSYNLIDGAYAFNVTLFNVIFPFNGQSVDIRHKLRRQKCKSVAFQFQESGGAGTTDRLTGIQALALEVGRKKGVNRLPAKASVG